MKFPILRRIFSQGFNLSTLKMALIAAQFSRPDAARICRAFLRVFISNGVIKVSFDCLGLNRRIEIRAADLQSDFCSLKELGIGDCYRLPPDLAPELVIDGGGNTGLFAMRAAVAYPRASIRICEPVPRNLSQIERHLAMNGVKAELLRVCIGGSPRSMPFYCREANQGSFDGALPFDSIIQVQVMTLDQLLAGPGYPDQARY